MQVQNQSSLPPGKPIIVVLSLMRIGIGWHFLYEGLAKLFDSGWSAQSYLLNAKWLGAEIFHWMANSPAVLQAVNWLNIWGLIAIGMALFFGAFTRLAAGLGIALLALYYIANPPFIGMDYGMPAEGHYLIVNKNLIEMMGLALLIAVPKAWIPGFDRLWTYASNYWKQQRQSNPYKMGVDQGIQRREVIKNLAALPIFGGFVVGAIKKKGWLSYEERSAV